MPARAAMPHRLGGTLGQRLVERARELGERRRRIAADQVARRGLAEPQAERRGARRLAGLPDRAVLGVARRDAGAPRLERLERGGVEHPVLEHAFVQRVDRGGGLAVESAGGDQPAHAGVEREALPLAACARARWRRPAAARPPRRGRRHSRGASREPERGERLPAARRLGDHRGSTPSSSRARGRALRGAHHRLDQRHAQAAVLELEDAVDRGAARRGDLVLELAPGARRSRSPSRPRRARSAPPARWPSSRGSPTFTPASASDSMTM